MSTTTADVRVRPRRESGAGPHVTFGRVLASEVRKITTLRSTWWMAGSAVVLVTGIGLLLGVAAKSAARNGVDDIGFDLSQAPVNGLMFAQLLIVAIASLSVTSEYSSGQIRVTLAAVPRRWPVVLAKVLVCSLLALVVGAVAHVLGVVGAHLTAGGALKFALSGAETTRIMAGSALYLVGIAIISVGFGFLVRSTAAAMATLMGFLLVVETVIQLVPLNFFRRLAPWLPSGAGQQLMKTQESVDAARSAVPAPVGAVLDPWAGYAVMIAWGVVLVVAAIVVLRRRDA